MEDFKCPIIWTCKKQIRKWEAKYRYYRDRLSAKQEEELSKSGEMHWYTYLYYVCKPPVVLLQYTYDKDTDTYSLVRSTADNQSTMEDLKLNCYQANSSVNASNMPTTYQNQALAQVYTTTGKIKAYDDTTSFTSTTPPISTQMNYQDLSSADFAKSTYSFNFVMNHETIYVVYIYGDKPEEGHNNPGYTKVTLSQEPDTDVYNVVSSQYIEDSKSTAKTVSVSFSDTRSDNSKLKDVGYTYASDNKPDIPNQYIPKPSANWGQNATDTYKYTGKTYPNLNQDLVVYAIYSAEPTDVNKS